MSNNDIALDEDIALDFVYCCTESPWAKNQMDVMHFRIFIILR